MSWHVSAVGRPAAVAASIAKQIEATHCSEPEQSIKASVGAAIASALASFPETGAVSVKAGGSQQSPVNGKAPNTVEVVIQPIYGFLEDAIV